MSGVYEMCFIGLLSALVIGAIVMLIRATVKYKMSLIWWIVSIPLWFAPGYVAYFEAKRKYLASACAPQKEISTARRQSVISLIFIIGAWVAMLIALTVVFLKSRADPSAFQGKAGGIIFWSLAAVILLYLLALWLSARNSKADN